MNPFPITSPRGIFCPPHNPFIESVSSSATQELEQIDFQVLINLLIRDWLSSSEEENETKFIYLIETLIGNQRLKEALVFVSKELIKKVDSWTLQAKKGNFECNKDPELQFPNLLFLLGKISLYANKPRDALYFLEKASVASPKHLGVCIFYPLALDKLKSSENLKEWFIKNPFALSLQNSSNSKNILLEIIDDPEKYPIEHIINLVSFELKDSFSPLRQLALVSLEKVCLNYPYHRDLQFFKTFVLIQNKQFAEADTLLKEVLALFKEEIFTEKFLKFSKEGYLWVATQVTDLDLNRDNYIEKSILKKLILLALQVHEHQLCIKASHLLNSSSPLWQARRAYSNYFIAHAHSNQSLQLFVDKMDEFSSVMSHDSEEIWILKAIVLCHCKQWEQAFSCTPFMDQSKKSVWTKASAAMGNGHLDLSKAYLLQLHQIAPQDEGFIVKLGKLYGLSKNLEKVIEYFDLAVEKNRYDPDTYYFYAASLYLFDTPETNFKPKLIELLDKSISLRPHHVEALNLRANVNCRLSLNLNSLNDLQLCISLRDPFTETAAFHYDLLGHLLIFFNSYESAIEAFKKHLRHCQGAQFIKSLENQILILWTNEKRYSVELMNLVEIYSKLPSKLILLRASYFLQEGYPLHAMLQYRSIVNTDKNHIRSLAHIKKLYLSIITTRHLLSSYVNPTPLRPLSPFTYGTDFSRLSIDDNETSSFESFLTTHNKEKFILLLQQMIESGHYTKALKFFKTNLALILDDFDLSYMFAKVFFFAGKHVVAQQIFSDLVAKDPSNIQARLYWIRTQMLLNPEADRKHTFDSAYLRPSEKNLFKCHSMLLFDKSEKNQKNVSLLFKTCEKELDNPFYWILSLQLGHKDYFMFFYGAIIADKLDYPLEFLPEVLYAALKMEFNHEVLDILEVCLVKNKHSASLLLLKALTELILKKDCLQTLIAIEEVGSSIDEDVAFFKGSPILRFRIAELLLNLNENPQNSISSKNYTEMDFPRQSLQNLKSIPNLYLGIFARIFMQFNEPTFAFQILNEALARAPRDPKIMSQRALYAYICNLQSAHTSLEQISKAMREVTDNSYTALYRCRGEILFYEKKFTESLEDFKKSPDDRLKSKIEYNIYSELGQHVAALEIISKLIRYTPNDSSLWVSKGQTLVNLSQVKEGIECFSEASKIDPYNFQAYYYRGCARAQNWKESSAELELMDQDFEISLKHMPQNLSQNIRRADLFSRLDNAHALIGLELINEALKSNLLHPESIRIQLSIFIKLKMYQEAYDSALLYSKTQEGRQDQWGQTNLLDLLSRFKNIESAKELFYKIRNSIKNIDFLKSIAQSLGRVGLYEEQVEILSKCIQKTPLDYVTILERAFAYIHLKEVFLAEQDFKKAYELNPNLAGIRNLINYLAESRSKEDLSAAKIKIRQLFNEYTNLLAARGHESIYQQEFLNRCDDYDSACLLGSSDHVDEALKAKDLAENVWHNELQKNHFKFLLKRQTLIWNFNHYLLFKNVVNNRPYSLSYIKIHNLLNPHKKTILSGEKAKTYKELYRQEFLNFKEICIAYTLHEDTSIIKSGLVSLFILFNLSQKCKSVSPLIKNYKKKIEVLNDVNISDFIYFASKVLKQEK